MLLLYIDIHLLLSSPVCPLILFSLPLTNSLWLSSFHFSQQLQKSHAKLQLVRQSRVSSYQCSVFRNHTPCLFRIFLIRMYTVTLRFSSFSWYGISMFSKIKYLKRFIITQYKTQDIPQKNNIILKKKIPPIGLTQSKNKIITFS